MTPKSKKKKKKIPIPKKIINKFSKQHKSNRYIRNRIKKCKIEIVAYLKSTGQKTNEVKFEENDESYHQGNGANRSWRCSRCDLPKDKFYIVAEGLVNEDGTVIPNRTDFEEANQIGSKLNKKQKTNL